MWLVIQFLNKAWSNIKAVTHWFSHDFEEFPPDESGELMRRYMMQRSWFDKICANWNTRSVFEKSTTIFSIVLISGLVGIVLGAPTILALSAAFLSFITHSLLVSHEQKRRYRAKIFAEESIHLNTTLIENAALLTSAVNEVKDASQKLKTATDDISKHTVEINTETHKIQEENAAIATVIDKVNASSSRLLAQQEIVELSLENMAQHLKACDTSISQSAVAISDIGHAAADFSKTVQISQQTHDKLSGAVNEFCLFVNNRRETTRSQISSPSDSDDDFLSHLERQNEEDDALLKSLGLK